MRTNNNPNQEQTESQKEGILIDFMEGRELTPMDALQRHKTFKLASRVSELRKAEFPINGVWHRVESGKVVMKYSM